MISLRNNFVDVPPDVRFQISWLAPFSAPYKDRKLTSQDRYPSGLHGVLQADLPVHSSSPAILVFRNASSGRALSAGVAVNVTN